VRAYVGIRDQPVYRRDAFVAGLRAAGIGDIRFGSPQTIDRDTVFLSWNRYGVGDSDARRVEAAGGTVLIAENGYVARGGLSPHSMERRDPYALARSFHNDDSVIPQGGGPERWDALGVDIKPWRADGAHVLVCPARSFGTPGRFMQVDWAQTVSKRLAALTRREIRVRPHPGNVPPKRSLAEDLRDCWAVVVWASSAGVHALIAGVPVITCAPYWIAKGAAGTALEQIERPPMPARLPTLRRLAWAQWHLAEIEGGEPFARLLERTAA
jgi:hypothetical protein